MGEEGPPFTDGPARDAGRFVAIVPVVRPHVISRNCDPGLQRDGWRRFRNRQSIFNQPRWIKERSGYSARTGAGRSFFTRRCRRMFVQCALIERKSAIAACTSGDAQLHRGYRLRGWPCGADRLYMQASREEQAQAALLRSSAGAGANCSLPDHHPPAGGGRTAAALDRLRHFCVFVHMGICLCVSRPAHAEPSTYQNVYHGVARAAPTTCTLTQLA